MRLGDSGFRTLLVSSDPAHSLGDALQLPLTGTPQAVDLLHHHNHHIQDTTSSGDYTGELWAMEIDPAAALEEFKNLVRNGSPTVSPNSVTSSAANPGNNGNGKGILSSLGLPDLGSEMSEMVFGIQEPPPGTDEIVALAKVIDYLDNGYTVNGRTVKFDRIVLDTAPTGHTLRMLQLPEFLQQTIAKLKAVRAKTSMSMGGMLGMFGGGSGGEGAGSAEELQDKTDALDRFRERMQRLETVLHSPKDCEFTAVTIPTELATSETQRLLDALQKNNIPVRRLIINQVLPSMEVSDVGSARDSSSDKGIKGEKGGAVPSTDKASAYLDKLRAGQQSSIAQLRTLAAGVNASLIEVPYFDTEVRTVYGLRLVSNVIVLVVMNTIK